MAASNWTFRSAASSSGSGATAAITTGTVKPNVGDLMVVASMNNSATTANNTIAISDTSAGGAAWNLFQSQFAFNGKFIGAGWYKIANAADANGGAGITITTTASGGTGTQLSRSECDIFSVPANLKVLDINGSGINNSTSNVNVLSCTAGLKYSTSDALYWTALGVSVSNGGLVGGSITPPGVSMAGTGFGNPLLLATALTNLLATATASQTGVSTFQNQWATARTNAILIGASFVYTAVDTSGLLPNILARPQ